MKISNRLLSMVITVSVLMIFSFILLLMFNNSSKTAKSITADDAEVIALTDAQLANEVTENVKCFLETVDGEAVYEVDIISKNKQYDYRIRANDGKILTIYHKIGGSYPSTSTYIAIEEAQNIAFNDLEAGISDVSVSKSALVFESSKNVYYDIVFDYKRDRYEYKIDAESGKILKTLKLTE